MFSFIKNKTWFILLFLNLFFLGFLSAASDNSIKPQEIKVLFNGEKDGSIHIYSISGDNYFYVRDISKAYNCQLTYHPVTRKVVFSKNNKNIDMYVKSTKVLIGKKKKRISLPTRYISDKLYIPAVFVFSKDFSSFSKTKSFFDSQEKTLIIEDEKNIFSPNYYSKKDLTEVRFKLKENLTYNWLYKKDESKIYITFPKGHVKNEQIIIDDGIIKNITLENKNQQAYITIFLNSNTQIKHKKLLKKPLSLYIEITGKSSSDSININSDISSADTANILPVIDNSSAAIAAAAVTSSSKKTKKLILLDAGHGGEDPGAIGKRGIKEKNINLSIVNELQQLFVKDNEYDVILSRTDDTFIPLVERTTLANEKKVDLFVSIHCNANPNKKIKGFEIYFLSENASDDDAAVTATFENSAIKYEGKPNQKKSILQELLWSMVVNEFINESSELCSFITSEIKNNTTIENRGVKQAGFFVLRGAQMPSVLIECAFLSNYKEEAKLNNKKFRQNIANCIYKGIKNYEFRRECVNAKK